MTRATLAVPISLSSPILLRFIPSTWAIVNLMYNSLQASLNHRFSHGFNVLFAYTYAHDLGNADGNVAGNIQDAHEPRKLEYGAGRTRYPSPLHRELSLPTYR